MNNPPPYPNFFGKLGYKTITKNLPWYHVIFIYFFKKNHKIEEIKNNNKW